MSSEDLFLYVDESGNFVFTPSGTQFLVFTAITTRNPLDLAAKTNSLKYELLKGGLKQGESDKDLEYFHASENKQRIRDRVFALINENLDFEIHSVIVEKRKTFPPLQNDFPRFYKNICGCLLKYILEGATFQQLFIITDKIPHRRKREAITKGLKEAVREVLGQKRKFQLYHLGSKSDPCLQLADYASWAIYRKYGDWGDIETRPYLMIRNKVKSEFDIFSVGSEYFYDEGGV